MKGYKNVSSAIVARVDDDGVSRYSCSVNDPEYVKWLVLGNTPDPADPEPPEVVAAKAAEAQYKNDVADARSYAKLTALQSMTPAQVRSWVTDNVTNLAQAQDAIATLAIAVSLLARKL